MARTQDYFADPPRDALAALLQEEVAALAELVSDKGRRAVAVLVTVIGDDGDPRTCSLLSNMDDAERVETGAAMIRAVEEDFGK